MKQIINIDLNYHEFLFDKLLTNSFVLLKIDSHVITHFELQP